MSVPAPLPMALGGLIGLLVMVALPSCGEVDVATFIGLFPEDGADVSCDEWLTAHFDRQPTNLQLLARAGGSTIPGSWERVRDDNNGWAGYWRGDDIFRGPGPISIDISWSGGETQAAYVAACPEIANHPEGQAFLVDFSEVTWLMPEAGGDALGALLGQRPLLLSIEEANPDGSLLLLGAAGTTTSGLLHQDLCLPSIDFSNEVEGRWRNPVFSIGPSALDMVLGGIRVQVDDLMLSMRVASDLGTMEAGRLAGLLDTRAFDPIFPGSAVGALCNLLETTVGTRCTACEDGELVCLDVEVEDLRAVRQDFLLLPRTEAMIASDPTCNQDG